MNLFQTGLGRVVMGAALPLAVIAGVMTASASSAATPTLSAPKPTIARSAVGSYTLAQVAQHGTERDCWSAINGSVYNLTAFIARHEGGAAPIIGLCGIDGSGMFNGQHGSQSLPNSTLTQYRIGALNATLPPVPATTYTFAQVQTHSTAASCWSVVGTTVYDLTSWIPKHPGGTAVITAMCGNDGSASFNGKHGSTSAAPSTSAQNQLAQFSIGSLSGTTGGGTAGGGTTPTPNTTATYTFAQVQGHATSASCWTVIGTKVYDLTLWIPKHPGGTTQIVALCGLDGSASFNGKHGSASPTPSATAQAALVPHQIGVLTGTTAPAATGTYTLVQVKTHNTQSNCWSAILGSVYNLTTWIPQHPGGTSQIIALCGTEGSVAFWGKHGASSTAQAALAGFKIGTQSDYVPVALPTPAVTPSVPAITIHGDYTMEEVSKHSTAADCWSVISGGIYGLSTWIPVHPGGAGVITPMCGQDGSAAYNGKHGSDGVAGSQLAKLRIGSVVGATGVVLKNFTIEDVAAHKSPTDCWSAVNDGVFDLTKWIPQHPGGPAVIQAMCGIDGSAAFTAKHGGNAGAAAALKSYRIGTLVVKQQAATPASTKSGKVYTVKQVRRNHFATRCLTVANRNVYNLTHWTVRHRTHVAFIRSVCGRNSTRMYNKLSGGPAKTTAKLKPFWVGTMVSATAPAAVAPAPVAAPAPSTTAKYTAAQVKGHSAPTDCWSIVSGGVYNLTAWVGVHPGGPAVIRSMCGSDGTAAFTSMHSASASAKAALATMQIGVVG